MAQEAHDDPCNHDNDNRSKLGLILVHAGAGNHNPSSSQQFKEMINQSLTVAEKDDALVSNNDRVLSVFPKMSLIVSQLLMSSGILESSELTNTGYGSCITSKCTVECDSSIVILDKSTFKRYQSSSLIQRTHRTPIAHSVGEIIKEIERSREMQVRKTGLGLTSVVSKVDPLKNESDETTLVSKRMLSVYKKYKSQLQTSYQPHCDILSGVSDTVGVTVSGNVGMISGVSSGGSMFKTPGRISCAGIVGAGNYSTISDDGSYCVNVMCSGNGEDIIQMDLSRYLCHYLVENYDKYEDKMVCDIIEDGILKVSKAFELRSIDNHFEPVLYVGVVGVLEHLKRGWKIVFHWHSTESFVFGYWTATSGKRFVFSRLKRGTRYQKGETMLH
ncbi:hypothetical protein CANARDRAFT_171095 [[Candida] arabinofermentans NRRL YB-2248]|uniref:Uncharacterized protein n=1 Tax=[Candida] arabinofermentans NRRL YB-2248 TaxID=983967 RepID=A0A1E4T013_9ASCO|nr:hypothetical protein CANARDRAFT_171095 [[Candida] arabinofermentans NRRL YB-2248]